MEIVIPTKIGMHIIKMLVQKAEINGVDLKMHLDWADEECEAAAIRMASYHQRTMAQYNKKAQPQLFRPRDLVLKRVFENIVEIGDGKLQPNWKGPYVVSKRAYYL